MYGSIRKLKPDIHEGQVSSTNGIYVLVALAILFLLFSIYLKSGSFFFWFFLVILAILTPFAYARINAGKELNRISTELAKNPKTELYHYSTGGRVTTHRALIALNNSFLGYYTDGPIWESPFILERKIALKDIKRIKVEKRAYFLDIVIATSSGAIKISTTSSQQEEAFVSSLKKHYPKAFRI